MYLPLMKSAIAYVFLPQSPFLFCRSLLFPFSPFLWAYLPSLHFPLLFNFLSHLLLLNILPVDFFSPSLLSLLLFPSLRFFCLFPSPFRTRLEKRKNNKSKYWVGADQNKWKFNIDILSIVGIEPTDEDSERKPNRETRRKRSYFHQRKSERIDIRLEELLHHRGQFRRIEISFLPEAS